MLHWGLGSRTQHHMGQTDKCDIQADSTPFQAVAGTTIKHTIKDTAQYNNRTTMYYRQWRKPLEVKLFSSSKPGLSCAAGHWHMAQCRRDGMQFTNVLTGPGTFTKLVPWYVHHGKRITSQHQPAQATHLYGRNYNGCLPECLQGGVFPHSGVGHVQWWQLCCLWWRQSLNRLPNSWVHKTTAFQLHS